MAVFWAMLLWTRLVAKEFGSLFKLIGAGARLFVEGGTVGYSPVSPASWFHLQERGAAPSHSPNPFSHSSRGVVLPAGARVVCELANGVPEEGVSAFFGTEEERCKDPGVFRGGGSDADAVGGRAALQDSTGSGQER